MRRAALVGLLAGTGVALLAAHRLLADAGGSPAANGLGKLLLPPVERPAPRALVVPTGAPPMLACDDARRVVAQARGLLASSPPPVDPRPFADALIDWLDPHGLWTAAPDSPVAASIRTRSRDLLAELESNGQTTCPVAEALGAELLGWVTDLRGAYAAAHRGATATTREEAFRLASAPAFEDGAITRPARELATELGARLGTIRLSYAGAVDDAADAALARALPEGMPWDAVLLAAAVRAYLPQIDPHGGWAPLDEETALYEIDLEAAPPPRLWRRMVRTALGIRMEETSATALGPGQLVLRVGDVATSCLSVEQAEQLAFVDADPAGPAMRRVSVLTAADATPRSLDVTLGGEGGGDDRPGGLESHLVPYGGGHVLVIGIGDVPDSLGEDLIAAIHRGKSEGVLVGVVLDLRGNGGGSTDGASNALGVLLPGATLFPLRRRDGTVEVERAPTPPPVDRWTGPVAALVDGDTASAAEMIAGALAAYRRGPVIGDRTYGKGCAQEYLDDEAHVGVLRLTTLLYALPDGSPVQLTGISPTLKIPMPRTTEREALLSHPLPAWHGPDVRDRSLVRETPWIGHGGVVGPCGDPTVCRALRALGAPRAPMARGLR